MVLKYKLKLKDVKLSDFKIYLFALFKAIIPKKKIKNISELTDFIKKKPAGGSQVTLYSYLKTRMGTRYVLMFDDDTFMTSVNKAKWNIYCISLQDLTLYTISYLKVFFNFQDVYKAEDIYETILNEELKNGMPEEIVSKGKEKFKNRVQKINWQTYYNSLPFNESALALYEWSPVAEELKTLDRKIVLNSMILKWDNIRKEFKDLIKF